MRLLVLGGIRSGKSAWAERQLDGRSVTYVATAAGRPGDPDWNQRIAAHQARRPPAWTTVEAGAELPAVLGAAPAGSAVLVDDVGNWLTGALDRAGAWDHPAGAAAASAEAAELVAAAETCPADLVLVTPEAGWSVVPATRAGRIFADAQGSLNQRLAAVCTDVVLVVAGLPQRLK
jgi:adenosylcobinamide kinase/adenosylcobinamide-phosphate guanylyltransferase